VNKTDADGRFALLEFFDQLASLIEWFCDESSIPDGAVINYKTPDGDLVILYEHGYSINGFYYHNPPEGPLPTIEQVEEANKRFKEKNKDNIDVTKIKPKEEKTFDAKYSENGNAVPNKVEMENKDEKITS